MNTVPALPSLNLVIAVRGKSYMPSMSPLPGVHYVAAAFGDAALVCEILMGSPREMYEFLVGTVGQARGITRMSVEIELMVTKRSFMPTPWTEPMGTPRVHSDDTAPAPAP